MPITDPQREKIIEVHQEANRLANLAQEAINVPWVVLGMVDRIDTTELYLEGVNMINHSKAKAITKVEDLLMYLSSVPDIS